MKNRYPVFLFIAILISVFVLPQAVNACPVCFSAKEGTREVYMVTALLLTFLPLGMIGSLLFWLRKHLQKRED